MCLDEESLREREGSEIEGSSSVPCHSLHGCSPKALRIYIYESQPKQTARLRGIDERPDMMTILCRVKQTSEQLHKHVGGVWTEAEETAKKVCS